MGAIREKAGSLYRQYNNHLENHIADNHVWQMTLRILTMASFATYNEIPEAALWANYCYNVWVARMPGLNKDGAWHNGDSYFTVNTRTLIEVPYFYSRLSGFDFSRIHGTRTISSMPSSSSLHSQNRAATEVHTRRYYSLTPSA